MSDHVRVEMNGEGSIESTATKSGLATCVAGLSLLIPACIGLFISRVPTALGPFPGMTAIPALFLSSRALAIAVPSLLFFVWNPGLFRGESKIPKRSHWLLAVVTILSVVWFTMSWEYGLQYQGARYVYGVCIANVVWIAFLGVMFAKWKGRSSFRLNLALHWLLFVWLAWYAFPYLGELP
jgi:drug/metabolite transporter (DMT)-like permease